MSEHEPIDDFDGPELKLWDTLAALPQETPSPALRRRVLQALDAHDSPVRALRRSRRAGTAGWMALAASTVVGVAIGWILASSISVPDNRIVALETQVDALRQDLLINRLNAASATDRLAAAVDAARFGRADARLTGALLQRATLDPVPSVRSAAIGSLANAVGDPAIADDLIAMLVSHESPIVQLAIIDLFLRYGDDAALIRLRQRAADAALAPALTDYINESIRGESI